MKISAVTGVALLSFRAVAFPAWLLDRDLGEDEMRKIARIAARIELEASMTKNLNEPRTVGFDAEQQYVSNTGDHAFVS